MKTIHSIAFLILFTVSALCQPIIIYGVAHHDQGSLTFTASEMHINEVLLSWRGDFHADDFDAFILSISSDGRQFEEVGRLQFDPVVKHYTTIVKTTGRKDIYFQLAGNTTDDQVVKIKTIVLPENKSGLSVMPLKSNNILYLNSSEACGVAIVNELGEVILELELKKGMQPIDISSFDLGRYRIQSDDFQVPTAAGFERI